jgi:hypothetical protein
MPARSWQPVVRRRDVREGRRQVGLPVPGRRPARQVIDVLLSEQRDLAGARRFFTRALRARAAPAEVTTDRAPVYPRVLDELSLALHTLEQYANNLIETDHGRLKARPRPMRGLKRHRSARILAAGHAFVQNLRRGHYDIATRPPRPPPAPHRLRRPGHHHLTGRASGIIQRIRSSAVPGLNLRSRPGAPASSRRPPESTSPSTRCRTTAATLPPTPPSQ